MFFLSFITRSLLRQRKKRKAHLIFGPHGADSPSQSITALYWLSKNLHLLKDVDHRQVKLSKWQAQDTTENADIDMKWHRFILFSYSIGVSCLTWSEESSILMIFLSCHLFLVALLGLPHSMLWSVFSNRSTSAVMKKMTTMTCLLTWKPRQVRFE